MSYRFTHGSEITFVDDSLPLKSNNNFCYDSDYNSNEDDIEFAETMSLDSAERDSIRKLYMSNNAAKVQFSPNAL